MILLIRKHVIFLVCILCCGSIVLSAIACNASLSAFSAATMADVTVIIDPGHGGEDGGAVSADGTAESGLNLEVSQRINDLLLFFGVQTIMTRTGEAAIHTEGETIRARKASDIRNRVNLVNNTPDAVLLSIHQNSLPSSPSTHGAQVFWNRQEGGEVLAKALQDTLNLFVNAGNDKEAKPISPTIYLMKHVTAPAVLVECGFLSNQAETALLKQPSYQRKLAMAITAGLFRGLAGEELP